MDSSSQNSPFDYPALRNDVDLARSRGQSIAAGFKNRAFSTGSATNPTTLTGASAAIVGAALLVSKTSGIFLATISASVTTVTAAQTLIWTVGSQTVASAIVLTNATKVGPGAGVSANGAYVSSAAAGITVTGGGGALTQYASGTQVQPTAGTTAQFSWSCIIHNSISSTVELPFTQGNQVLLTLSVTSSGSNGTFAGFAISLEELPS